MSSTYNTWLKGPVSFNQQILWKSFADLLKEHQKPVVEKEQTQVAKLAQGAQGLRLGTPSALRACIDV